MSITPNVVKLKGTLQFPKLEVRDVWQGSETSYGATIGNLSTEAVDAIEETYGATGPTGQPRVKFKEALEFGKHIKITSMFPIIPKDVDGNSFEGRTADIGYGSVVGVILKGDKKGNPRIASMTVLELVSPTEGLDEDDNDFL